MKMLCEVLSSATRSEEVMKMLCEVLSSVALYIGFVLGMPVVVLWLAPHLEPYARAYLRFLEGLM
jgi:hypothetical protein